MKATAAGYAASNARRAHFRWVYHLRAPSGRLWVVRVGPVMLDRLIDDCDEAAWRWAAAPEMMSNVPRD